MNKRNLAILTLLIVAHLSASAQHKASPYALSSGGGYFKNASHSNSWTVGQLATKTISNANHKVTQGFQQPDNTLSIAGKIQSELGAGIPGVTVTLSGSTSKIVTTASDGLYKFNVAKGGNYTITPSKSNDVTTNNGVTTTDIALIRRHVLNTTYLNSPYKTIAADANNSGNISTADIPPTRIVTLSNTAKFPPSNSRLWEFVNSDQTFPGSPPVTPYNPFPFIKTRTYSNLASSQINQNFIGVKIGDVNNSWNAAVP